MGRTKPAIVFRARGIAIIGPMIAIYVALRADMNRQFEATEKNADKAHAQIGENIKRLERRAFDSLERHVDSGLGSVHTQLAAITPRATAERTPPDPA